MAYSDFTLERVRKELGVSIQAGDLFTGITPAVVPGWLADLLERTLQVPRVSEKARGEVARDAGPAWGA